MRSRQRSVARRSATSLLIVLLAVPMLLSAHGHGAQELQDQHCAACTLIRHSPVVSTVTISAVAPEVARPAIEFGPILPVTRIQQRPQAGRAPPAPALGIEA